MNLTDSTVLQSIVEIAPIGICILSADNFVAEMVNDQFLEITGKSKDSLIGKPYWESFTAADESDKEELIRVVSSKTRYVAKAIPVTVSRNGAEQSIDVTFVYAPVANGDGLVTKIAVWLLEANQALGHERDQLNKSLLRSNRQVKQANSNLEQILNMLPASVVVIRGYNLIVEMINDANLAYWMKTRQEVIGKPFLEILPDLADQPFASQLRHVMKTGEVIDVQESPVLFTEKDGSIRETYVDYTYQPLSDLDGNYNGVLVMSFEITDRVKSRKLLEKFATDLSAANHELSISNLNLAISEARFKHLIQEAPVAIGLLHSREMIIETANQRILDVWGKTAEIMHQPIAKAIPELEGQPFLGLLDKVYTSGEPFYADEIKALLNHQGKLKEIFFNVVYHPLTDHSGTVSDILVVAVDVTQQVTSRKKVEQAELTTRLAAEAGNVGTWNIDTLSRQFNTSVRLKEMFGFDTDRDITLNDTLLQVTEDYKPQLISIFHEMMQKGGKCDVTFTITRLNDGMLRWIRALGSSRTESAPKHTSFAGVILDITDIKLEEQRKSDFIGMVSHELKTPLTSLNGYLQIMYRKAKAAGNDVFLSAFENSLKQVRQMTTLINGFLNISRLESGKIHIDRTLFDFSELMKELETEHQHLYSSHQLVFHGKGEAIIDADRHKIAQVVNNLVSNAAKYAPADTRIDIHYECTQGILRISVTDQGMGIKSEDLSRLFERYYRVENNGNISGFGIGLYLCAEIIERHDGRIWAESTPGKGSVFYVELNCHG